MSGRNRIPLSGRSNYNDQNIESARVSGRSRPDTDRSTVSITDSLKERLNDPLEVFRPFSAEDKVMNAHIVRPPILPRSRYPTIPPEASPPKPKILSCPDDWKDKLNAPSWFETADFKTLVNEDEKKNVCRAFVERNKDRLWKYNLEYLNRSPHEVCQDMVENPRFIGLMKSYLSKERVLRLNSSEKCMMSMKDSQFNSLGEIKTDLSLNSLTTSRTAREEKMNRLFSSGLQQHGTAHFRGYNHTPEYGNFSRYSGIMQSNSNATLKR